MSLPLLSSLLEQACSPHVFNQQFGSNLKPEDILFPIISGEFRNLFGFPAVYSKPKRSSTSQQNLDSTVSDGDKFQANLDVQQFKPSEITVKVSENTVTVEGKHEEREDEHGYISRHFVRRYILPEGHDVDKIESKLSLDGVLTITAPKIDAQKNEQRIIPVVQTHQPSKVVQQKEDKKEEINS